MPSRILRLARHGSWVALLVACGVSSACNGSQSSAPQAFMEATVGAVSGSPGLCNFASTQQWLDIGTPVADLPTTQADGSSQAGGAVHVSCTVATSGNGFDIALSATAEGTNPGSLVITSETGQGTVTSNGATTGISAAFESGDDGVYRETDCSIAFTYQGQPITKQPPIAAGRIWGHLSCPHAQISGQTTTAPDGGSETRACDGEADFLFEQCGL